ncbi:MAG: UvrD-helicase domain-containing protein [Acidobacteriota bacterium]
MDFLQHLNPEQRSAVLHAGGPLLILAGAGSGKTRVIAFRVAYLVGSGLARPGEVLAVTFTNKAAEEMRQRVEGLLDQSFAGLWISTFHSLCARLLRREGPAIGLSRDFVIYDSSDQLALIKQVLREQQIDESFLQPRAALSRISHAKNQMLSPQAVAAARANYRDDVLARVYQDYVKALAACGAVDFDDLLLKTVELFEASPETRARYSQRFRYVMVDEYQDTNRPQYLLMRHLAGQHRNLAVVGDPDQSIYAWRGADIRNILDFEHDFPEAVIVRLEQNYRSTQVILDSASAVIANNRNRKEKRLWTDRRGGEAVVYARCGDELQEADFVARTARGVLQEDPGHVVAVLYRTNAQSRVIEDAFRRESIVYRIVGGVRFYERKEVKDTLAYLKLLLNPHDNVSLRRIINTPARGIGKGVMETLEAFAGDGHFSTQDGGGGPGTGDRPLSPLLAGLGQDLPKASLWSALELGLAAGRFPARAAASLQAFRDLLLSLADSVRQEPVSIAIAKVLDRSGYLQDLREDRSEESEGRIENLAELVSAAREYEARDPEPSLAAFVDRLSLLSEADESEGAADARVLLMTLHSAKGLEFPAVFIMGLEEGLFPHSRSSDDDGELEEERRLCYVGMTRARLRLFLSSAARRRVFGEYRATEPSRFLDEVPAGLVQRYDFIGRPSAFGTSAGRGSYYRQRGEHLPGSPSPRSGRVREAQPPYAYEDEDQSVHAANGMRLGMRVRHPQFGEGTVVGVEPAHDDLKVTVRFASVGVKRLLASYARLERA